MLVISPARRPQSEPCWLRSCRVKAGVYLRSYRLAAAVRISASREHWMFFF